MASAIEGGAWSSSGTSWITKVGGLSEGMVTVLVTTCSSPISQPAPTPATKTAPTIGTHGLGILPFFFGLVRIVLTVHRLDCEDHAGSTLLALGTDPVVAGALAVRLALQLPQCSSALPYRTAARSCSGISPSNRSDNFWPRMISSGWLPYHPISLPSGENSTLF